MLATELWWRRNPHVPIETIVEHLMTVVWPGLQNRLNEATA